MVQVSPADIVWSVVIVVSVVNVMSAASAGSTGKDRNANRPAATANVTVKSILKALVNVKDGINPSMENPSTCSLTKNRYEFSVNAR